MTEREYLLTCLMEECGELIQRVSKALRFGENEIQPGQEETNLARMEDEYSDVLLIADKLGLRCLNPREEKLKRWNAALERAKEHGTL
jgi:NTP pyrophosphatase (non-canonical NTP hydrolase)